MNCLMSRNCAALSFSRAYTLRLSVYYYNRKERSVIGLLVASKRYLLRDVCVYGNIYEYYAAATADQARGRDVETRIYIYTERSIVETYRCIDVS